MQSLDQGSSQSICGPSISRSGILDEGLFQSLLIVLI